MPTRFTSRILCGLTLSLTFGLSACGPSQGISREDDQVVGRPPSVREDPFLNGDLPAEAQRVDSQGSITIPDNPKNTQVTPGVAAEASGASGAPSDALSGPDSFPVAGEAPGEPSPDSGSPSTVPPSSVTSPSLTGEPDAERLPSTLSSYRCYSCVRVCAQSDGSGDCSQSKEDMVCGWGHSEERADAQTLAQAQCDATLELMRQTPQWSSIDGQCPAASCR